VLLPKDNGGSMPEYRPIPGQNASSDLPMDDLTRMATESASKLLMPYQEKFGLKPIVPGEKANPVPVSPSASAEDKLYESIHPSTFSKVMETIMSLVTGKPIPRQEGGPADPNKKYIVGERGPEVFTPNVPGQITPGEQLMGSVGTEWPGIGPQAYRAISRTMTSPYESPYEPGLPKFQLPRISGKSAIDMVRDPVTGTYDIPEAAPSHGIPSQGAFDIPPESLPSHTPVDYGWKDYGEGMRYRVGPERFFKGGREVAAGEPGAVSGDELARQRIYREPNRFYGIPEPGRGYYDAHPEERAMDIAREETKPLMDVYQKQLDRYSNIMQGFGLPMNRREAAALRAEAMNKIPLIQAEMARLSAEPGKYYKAGMEYGPTSPAAQERLAHAEYYRRLPGLEMAKLSEQGRMHLEGINRQVAGHIEAAKIAAEVKDPIMKEIGTVLTQGQKMSEMYGTPFDPQQTIGSILNVYHAMGQISEDQWAKLPKEYKPPVQGARLAPDGNWYIPDPKRKGKYLRVD
jgi:hypothetical protein